MKSALLLLTLLLASCIDENRTPEGALKEFVETSVGHVITREYVLERVTGKMRQSFEIMDDEDFKKFADLRNVKKNSFKILSKSCQEKKCFLTYSISFNSSHEKSSFSSDVKKIAELMFIEGKWLIADVSNIKTYHEALDPINPLE